MDLILSITFTIILLLGVIDPKKFIKLTEFWRIGMKREPSPLMLKITRYMSAAAIGVLWIRFVEKLG